MRGIVVHRADDYASRALHHLLRRFAAGIGKPTHFSGMSASKPFGNARKFRPGIYGNNAAKIEANCAGLLRDPSCAFGLEHDSKSVYCRWFRILERNSGEKNG